tara:strand:+ start:89 stop:772 length:684 start_codon:yes stop_codon:yes gene_type:complete
MDNNKIISKEIIVLDTPPNATKLKAMKDDELKDMCKSLKVPREQYEGKDEDKNRIFMINEITRLRPPVPPIEKPVLVDVIFDEEKMTKTLTFRYLKHIMNGKEYKHSVKTLESYNLPLDQKELQNETKGNLMNSIQTEVSGLNLGEYLTKESILNYACNNGKSSGEKRKRVNTILKAIQPLLKEKLQNELQEYEENKYVLDDKGKKKKNIKPKYNHIRITNYDISVH